MAKKPAPENNEPQPGAPALDASVSPPTPDASPAPAFDSNAAIHGLAAAVAKLTERVDALAAQHLLNTDKVI